MTKVKSVKINANNDNLQENVFRWNGKHLQKGQRIIFEGGEACVIRVKPFLLIKTKKGVVCGALHKCVIM